MVRFGFGFGFGFGPKKRWGKDKDEWKYKWHTLRSFIPLSISGIFRLATSNKQQSRDMIRFGFGFDLDLVLVTG
jgi:hypothetical protein